MKPRPEFSTRFDRVDNALVDPSDNIVFAGGLTDNNGVVSSALKDIQFSDGTSINLEQPLTFTWYGTSSNYSLNGSDYGVNIFDITVGVGNGSITLGNTSGGGNGDNTINYAEGDGNVGVSALALVYRLSLVSLNAAIFAIHQRSNIAACGFHRAIRTPRAMKNSIPVATTAATAPAVILIFSLVV
jgi:hypothetical protein